MYIALCSGLLLDTSTSAVSETVTQGEVQPHKHQMCERGTHTKSAFLLLFPVASESETNAWLTRLRCLTDDGGRGDVYSEIDRSTTNHAASELFTFWVVAC